MIKVQKKCLQFFKEKNLKKSFLYRQGKVRKSHLGNNQELDQ